MNILIKGMDMPKCCFDCSCLNDEYCQCQAIGKTIEVDWIEHRPDWCPLIEVPEWIPVTERLPNGNGKYLVSGKDKVWVCEFMILGDVGGWCNSAMNPCVKYWMPLPEPPKDGET